MNNQTFVLLIGITITLFFAFALSVFMSLFTLSDVLFVAAFSFVGFVLILMVREIIESEQNSKHQAVK
ncbi:MAG: hypothetical protein QXU98_06790 [Candidatus Parvarchaeota archaeon]